MNRLQTDALLALVHSYPIRMQQLQKILSLCSSLYDFPTIPYERLKAVFRQSPESIKMIKKTFSQHLHSPLVDHYKQHQIHIIPFTDVAYPPQLLQLHNPPIILFAKGQKRLLTNTKCIASIGSRQASAYSLDALKLLLPPLIANDYTIVSGLAKGADTLSHKLTLHYGGNTIAVLGHGLHMVYPKENEALARMLSKEHLLISEYPLGVGPKKHHFPMRNRIISGLSEALIVTEATLRSGTMITTEQALEAGKDVFVVPGPITSPLSLGTNKLLNEGAIPVVNGYQILEELHVENMKN